MKKTLTGNTAKALKKRFCKNRAAAQNCAIKGFGKFPTSKETAGFREGGDRRFSASVYTLAQLAFLVFRFLGGFQELAGALDHLLHGNNRGALEVLDVLADTAVFHTPGHTFAFLQIGEVLGLSDPQFLEGHGSVLNVLLDTLVVEHRRLLQKAHLGVLRRFLLKGRRNGILRRRFCSYIF